MRRTTLIAGAALIVLAAAGPALALKGVRAPVLSDNAAGASLDWRIRPSVLQVAGIARGYSVSGGAMTVECVLDRNGRPDDCVDVADGDGDLGFLRFTQEVAHVFKAASKDSLGGPVAGRKVTFKLEFGGESNL
jgi:hypothetical protein